MGKKEKGERVENKRRELKKEEKKNIKN